MKLKLLFSDTETLASFTKEALIGVIIKYDQVYQELIKKKEKINARNTTNRKSNK